MHEVMTSQFWLGLGAIVWVNIILSGDNAVVIALAARSLPEKQQKQAVFWGAAAAVVLRIVLTVVAVELLKLPYLKIIGGALLFWIALKLLMPEDQSLEVQEFDASLKEMLSERVQVHDLLAYWERGDVSKLSTLLNSGFHNNPRAEKALFENRNRAWIVQLKKMLAENHTFFVTVGAGHLAGPKGVPALLRHEGYKVDGP